MPPEQIDLDAPRAANGNAAPLLRIFYDGECPMCARYVTMLRLQRSGPVALVDLRSAPDQRRALEAVGFDLDEGMVVEDAGRRYAGADAVAYLAALSTPSDMLNQLHRLLLSNSLLAAVLYPIMRSGRWLLLFLLERRMIGDCDESNRSRREIFTTFFGIFSLFHVCNAVFEYGVRPPTWDLFAVLGTAVFAMLRPASARSLFLLVLASTVSTVLQAPMSSNHTIVRAFTLAGYWLSFGVAMARNDHVAQVFERFAPAGCGALLVMYVFGIFHKINTGFLDPATSCALALWRMMPQPLGALDGPVIAYGAIYGTFVVEGLVAAALLNQRLRHIGIALGMAFHLLLSLSSYAMYISFTTLAMALHTLFLNERAARRVLDSPLLEAVRARLAHPLYKLAMLSLALALAVFAFTGRYTLASLAAFPLVLPFCCAVLRHGAAPGPLESRRPALAVGGVTTALFFANCMMPYFGLKTAQAVNMFANLRIEGGQSNHLVFTSAPGPFRYLERVARVEDAGGDGKLAWAERPEFGVVFYELLARLEARPDLRVTFTLDGKRYANVSAADLAEERKILHPVWFRKFFHFKPVPLEEQPRCST